MTLDDLLSLPNPAPPVVEKVSPWADDTVGVCLYQSFPEDTYANDPYIKSIAIGKTPCFGGYDAGSTVCGGCPVSGSCLSHQILRLSKIAEGLRRADLAAETRANKAAQTVNTVSDTARAQFKDEDLDDILDELSSKDEPKPGSPPPPLDPNRGTKISATVESRCYSCKGTIPKGAAALHVPNKGIRHETCT
jgi:cytochrome c553